MTETNPAITLAPGNTAFKQIPCPGGRKVVGGGYSGLGEGFHVYVNRPNANNAFWEVGVKNVTAGNLTHVLTGYAICVTAQ